MSELHPIPLPASFLGAGAMGCAIIRGLLNASIPAEGGIRATGHWSSQLQELSDAGVTAFDSSTTPSANIQAVSGAGLIVLAVKPDVVPKVLKEIAEAVEPGAVVVSIAAGISIAALESILPTTVPVVRVMPNIPAVVGRGVTGISPGTHASDQDLAIVERLFQTVGSVLTVPENQLDAVTSISGSGPAYVFCLIELLTEVAIDKGFTPEQAALLVNGTFSGASELLASTGRSPRELRAQVTSPNGTTAAAIAVMEASEIKQVLKEATDAAFTRAKELGL